MIVAHQGGWDEILIFVIPVLAVLFLLRRAERRSRSVDVAEVDADEVAGGETGEQADQRAGEDPDPS